MTFMKLFKNKLEENKGFGKKIINLSYKNFNYSMIDPCFEKSIMNISQQLMDMVPTVWEEIHYMGVVRKKGNGYEYYSAYYFKEEMINHWCGSYTIVDKYHIEERRFLNLLSKLNDELEKIYNMYLKKGNALWDLLYLTINSEGRISDAFLYDRTQNGNLNNIECEVKWAYEKIGIIPEEDSHKSIFDYLIQSHLPVHMRDKLKDEIYFDQYIAWREDFIASFKNGILEDETRYDDFTHTIYLESEKLLNAKYSRGYSICEIKEIYDWMVAQINEPWCLNTYGDQLFLISMGILLNVDKSILNKIKERLIELKEKDWLLDFFLNYEEGVDMDTFYPKLKFKNYCEKLKEIACATENQEELLTVYVTKLWYRKNRGSAWYNSHKDTQNTYFGYWCFEGAALAKLLHIPDEQLKECKYYPYDLAHYEGGN